jgi:hypothetical protein
MVTYYNPIGLRRLLGELELDQLSPESLSYREKNNLAIFSKFIPQEEDINLKVLMSKYHGVEMAARKSIPERDQTSIIAAGNLKVAALFFDRVWVPYFVHIKERVSGYINTDKELLCVSEAIRFFGDTDRENELWASLRVPDIVDQCVDDCEFQKRTVENAELFLGKLLGVGADVFRARDKKVLGTYTSVPFLAFFSKLAIALNSEYHCNTQILLSNVDDCKQEYTPGNCGNGLFVGLRDVALPDENAITWQQIDEFRKDTVSLMKVRKIVKWFDLKMIGQSPEFIKEEIGTTIENFCSSLIKHGMKMIKCENTIGVLLDIFNLQKQANASGRGSSINMESILEIKGYSIGETIVEATDMKVNCSDLHVGPNSEILFVYEVKGEVPNGLA